MRCFSICSGPFAAIFSLWLAASTLHAAPAPNALPGYVIVPLGRGHMNRYCLAATVSGIKGLAMLDTGASRTALSDSTYRSLLANGGNLPAHAPKTASVNGLSSPLVLAPNLVVANVDVGKFVAPLVPGRYLFNATFVGGEDRAYDLLLGEEFLRHFRAVVDCGRLALYLNTDPAKHLSLSSAFVAGGWTRVPMTDLGNDFTVPCSLNGHRFRLIVDTGAAFGVLDRGQARTIGIQALNVPGFRSGLIGTRAEEAAVLTIDGMHIGDYVAPTTHMITAEQSFAKFGPVHEQSHEGVIAGLLGPDLLAENAAIVDVGNKALYLKRR